MSERAKQEPFVRIVNINVLDNPSTMVNPFQFEIVFESKCDLNEDLEWKLIYVGDHRSVEGDQILDSILVGPVCRGTHKICFQTAAPDVTRIPDDSIIGITVILLTCSYKTQEFVRVGYYVNNSCNGPWSQHSQIERTILVDKPKITHLPISWD